MKKNLCVSYIFFAFTVICSVFSLAFPYEVAYYCSNALKMCGTSLIPSLFTFMVLSKILSHLSAQGTFNSSLSRFLARLLNLPDCLIPICLLGLIGGAPSGAFAIGGLYKKGLCTKSQAEKACVLANNCSAAFILGVISAVLGSKTIAVYILITNIISTVTVYFIFFRRSGTHQIEKQSTAKKEKLSHIITESITSSAESIIKLCGFVIFFYTFSCIISQRTTILLLEIGVSGELTDLIKSVICSLLELTSGVLSIGNISVQNAMLLCSMCVSFTGLSIIFQVKSVLDNHTLSAAPFIQSRFLCAVLSPVLIQISHYLSSASTTVSTLTETKKASGITGKDLLVLISVTIIAFIGAYILNHLDKKHKK